MQDRQYRLMIATPPKRLVLKMALPSVLSMLMTSIGSLLDAFYVSGIGEREAGRAVSVGAVGVVFSVIALLQTVGFTLGIGGGCVLSRMLGQKKNEEASRVASFSLALSFALGLLVALIGLFCFSPILRLLGASSELLPYARRYALFVYLSAPFMTSSITMSSLLRAEGKTAYSFFGLAVGSLVNGLLAPFLIFSCNMGIRGASLAILISQALSVGVFLFLYGKRKTVVSLSVKRILLAPRMMLSVLSQGIPSLFRQGFAFGANIYLVHVASRFGNETVSAVTVAFRVFMLFFGIALGIGQGYQPIAGYNHGAGEHERVGSAFHFSWIFGSLLMAALGAILFWTAPYGMPLLLKKGDRALSIAIKLLRFQALSLPFIPLNVIVNMTFQATRKKWLATLLASCRQGLIFLPLLFFLPRYFGLVGLELAQALADLFTFAATLPFAFFFVRRLSKEHLRKRQDL